MVNQDGCPKCHESNYLTSISAIDPRTGAKLSRGNLILGIALVGTGCFLNLVWVLGGGGDWKLIGFGLLLIIWGIPLIRRFQSKTKIDLRQLVCQSCGYGWNLWGAEGDEAAIEGLMDRLKSGDSNVRKDAAAALVEAPDLRSKEALIQTFDDEDKDVRAFAVAALGHFKDPDLLELLIKALRDEDGGVQTTAVEAVGSFLDARIWEPLVKTMIEGNRWAAAKAFRKLSAYTPEEMVEPLIKALKAEQWEVRVMAAELLGKQKDTRAIDALTQAKNDESMRVRMAAKKALKMIKAGYPRHPGTGVDS